MVATDPPVTPLPDDVLALMNRTLELVDLLYWTPVPSVCSSGELAVAGAMAGRQQNHERLARPDSAKTIENGSGEEKEMMEDEARRRSSRVSSRRKRMRWFASQDLEYRQAYGRAIMSGHGMLVLLLSLRTAQIKPVLSQIVIMIRPCSRTHFQ